MTLLCTNWLHIMEFACGTHYEPWGASEWHRQAPSQAGKNNNDLVLKWSFIFTWNCGAQLAVFLSLVFVTIYVTWLTLFYWTEKLGFVKHFVSLFNCESKFTIKLTTLFSGNIFIRHVTLNCWQVMNHTRIFFKILSVLHPTSGVKKH